MKEMLSLNKEAVARIYVLQKCGDVGGHRNLNSKQRRKAINK